MGPKLQQLGAYGFKHKWRILIGWAVALAALGFLAMQFSKPTVDGISIPGTEAQKTLDRFGELFPDAGKGSARVVFEASQGKTIDDFEPQVANAARDLALVTGVTQAISPFVNTEAISSDRTIAYVQIQLSGEHGTVSKDTIDGVGAVVETARANDLRVEEGGDVVNKVPGEILGIGEVAGVAIALLVLVMTLGSLISAGMPIVIAIVTIGASMAGLFALSHVIEINSTTPVLAVMLGLAVGIDYSLFIISKYKHYLLEGYDEKTATAKAVGTAGSAVVFAAGTVVIALAALAIVQIPFMTTMGLAGAATVALAAIVAVTLIPALLGLAGTKVFRKKTRTVIIAAQKKGPHETHDVDHASIWYRWGKALAKHPVIILVSAVLVVAAIALPVRDLKLGLPTDQYSAVHSTERKAYDTLTRGFGAGFNGPLLLVAEGIPAVSDADKAAVRTQLTALFEQEVSKERAAQEQTFTARAAAVTSPAEASALQQDIATAQTEGATRERVARAQLETQIAQYGELYQLNKVAERITALDGVAKAQPALATAGGSKGVIQVIPTTSPSDEKTLELIERLRSDSVQRQVTATDGASIGVTGTTALEADVNAKLAGALPQYLAVVVGLSLVLLVIAFRSILVPIKATLGFLLSVLAMFGALVAVFQWGWFGIADTVGPIVSFIPIIATGILFGLAMDYEFFLVSSMHEAYGRTGDAKKSVVTGFGQGSKVVTAAGVIMVAVFAGFIFNHDATIQAIGFGLAIGVFIDAFIVRMTIVPAVMTLLGKRAWWLPAWLDARLPHVSIEGEEVAAPAKK